MNPEGRDQRLREAARRLRDEFAELDDYGKFVTKVVNADQSWPCVQVGTGAWLMLKARIANVIAALDAPADNGEHEYLSTACYHGQHDRCRKECKFCSVACKCGCHWLLREEKGDAK